MEKNLFELASREKYRFATSRGTLTVEDLWGLSMGDLDAIYAALKSDLQGLQVASLLTPAAKKSSLLENMAELVAYVFGEKQRAAASRLVEKQRRDKAARVRELIAQKEDETLSGKSLAELQALVDDLEHEG